MKRISILLILINLLSCTSENLTDESSVEYAKSLNEWNKQKLKNGNTYQYTILSSSVLGGYSKTTITVNNGIVTSREYNYYEGYYPEDIDSEYSYSEDINSLNSNNRGYKAILFDEVYIDCSSNFLSKSPGHITNFKADDNGLLNICSYEIGDDCQDDCSPSIKVSEFKWL